MGCASSKKVEAASVSAADVYHLPPSSIAVFDINTIEEPWLITTTSTVDDTDKQDKQEEYEYDEIKKPALVSLPILAKLETYELAPQLSWSEVSKALQEEIKKPPAEAKAKDMAPMQKKAADQPPRKSTSFRSVKDLEAAAAAEAAAAPPRPLPELTGRRPVKENSFILRDRLEREGNKAADAARAKWRRPNPLEGYEERRPPGNPDGVVLYTTTLRGVRRTFEDCEWARRVVYPNAVEAGVEVDERDVSLHGEFLKELRGLVGDAAAVPRLFVMGRYVGGIEEMVEVNESGKMREMMRWVVAKKGGKRGGEARGAWVGCEGCGGSRFVPCMECNGSCKVVGEDGKGVLRCTKCNENGLVMCPLCH